MSTRPITKKESKTDDVIVRAFGGEPVRLTAVSASESAIQVCGEDREKTMGFPVGDVFSYDPAVFRELHKAFLAGNANKLTSTWKRAVRFTPAA
jgi:hypothetical protein